MTKDHLQQDQAGTVTYQVRQGGRRKQAGFALMEVLLGVGLLLVASIGGYVIYQQATSTNEMAAAREELGMIRSSTNRLFANQSSFTGLSNTVAIKAGIVPASMATGDSTIANVFGGNVTIAPDDGSGGGQAARSTDSHYMITYPQVPQEACIQLATYDRTEWEGGVSIGGTAIGENDVATASSSCSGDENTLVFVGR